MDKKKQKKQKKQKGNIKEAPKVLEEWLYLSEDEKVLRRFNGYLTEAGKEVQLWEEAGVLETELAEGGCMDVELLEEDQWDGELFALAAQRRAVQIYTVLFPEANGAEAYALMKELAGKAGGCFCKDTEGFLPEIKGRGTEDGDRS